MLLDHISEQVKNTHFNMSFLIFVQKLWQKGRILTNLFSKHGCKRVLQRLTQARQGDISLGWYVSLSEWNGLRYKYCLVVHVRIVKESGQNLMKRAENAGVRKHCCLQSNIYCQFCIVCSNMLRKKMQLLVNVFKQSAVSKMLLEMKDKLMSYAVFQNGLLHPMLQWRRLVKTMSE